MSNDSFYSHDELLKIGFHFIGKHVLVSRKASIYSPETIEIGNNVRIDDFCILSGKIKIGNYIHIAAYSALYGGKDGIFIDDFANLSSRVSVYSISDDYSGLTMTNPMVPDQYKNLQSASVYIGRHVIIASTSVVLPGVHLADGSAFGAFSLIDHNSDPFSINVGIPFQKIKERSRYLLELEENFSLSSEYFSENHAKREENTYIYER